MESQVRVIPISHKALGPVANDHNITVWSNSKLAFACLLRTYSRTQNVVYQLETKLQR